MPIGFRGKHAHKFVVAMQNKKIIIIIIIWRNGRFVPSAKIMYTISYAFNISFLIVIIVKDYLSGFISIYVCIPRCSKTSDRAFYQTVGKYKKDLQQPRPILAKFNRSTDVLTLLSPKPLCLRVSHSKLIFLVRNDKLKPFS